MRTSTSLTLTLVVLTCGVQVSAQSEAHLWQPDPSPAAECTADDVEGGPPPDQPVLLERQFEAKLMELVTVQPVREPHCWYEVSSRELLLRMGPCDERVYVHLRNIASGWSMEKVDVITRRCR
jgi:hypothetical protein